MMKDEQGLGCPYGYGSSYRCVAGVSRPDDKISQVYGGFSDISGTFSKIAKKVSDVADKAGSMAKGSGQMMMPGASDAGTVSYQQSETIDNTQKAIPKEDNTMLYGGIALAVVAGYFILKK